MPNVIGNQVTVRFSDFNKDVEGKVDTGATVSSLHAENIEVDESGNLVTFVSPFLSANRIKMECEGVQQVASADGGNNSRPTVRFNVTVDGKALPDQVFNLNDRSNMDSPILIGQNILKAGDFHIDVNKDGEEVKEALVDDLIRAFEVLAKGDVTIVDVVSERLDENEASPDMIAASKMVADSNITIREMVTYLKAVANKNNEQ